MSENNNLDFLDLLGIISFALQMSNRQTIISIEDIQNEVNRAVEDVHKHLLEQDKKIDKLLEVLT